MVCESCGEKPKNTAKDFTKAVIEINNPEQIILFRKVVIPTSMGDDTTVPPAIGKYRNVLLVYEANNHAYLYSSDGIPTLLTSDVAQDLEEKIDAVAEDLQTEVTARENADTALDNRLTTVEGIAATALQPEAIDKVVMTDISLNPNTSTTTVQIDGAKENLLTGATTTKNIPLPVASHTEAGVMNSSTFDAVTNNSNNINALLNGAVAITGLSANPSQSDLTTAWEAQTGLTTLMNRAGIYDVTNNKVWTYYSNDTTWYAASNTTQVTINTFTNSSEGTILGSTNVGQIFAENDGTGSVNGWDALSGNVSTNTSNITSLQTAMTGKQDKLTAGANITISPTNVISASGTEYTAGNAITIENNTINADIYPADFFTNEATDTDTGSNITLDKTIPATLKSVELYGDTEQQTYSGKNLLNPDVYQSGVNIYYPAIGFTFTNTQSSDVTCSYTDTGININTSIQHGGGAFMSSVLSAGTYHFSATVTAGSNNNARVSYSILDANRTVIDRGDYGTTQAGATRNYDWTITVPNAATYIVLSFSTSAASGGEITVSNPQLETGSTATSYEKFVGGTASPNPDYPQDVNVVTGEQTVTVTGKNLFNTSLAPKYSSGATPATIPTGLRITATTTSGNTFCGFVLFKSSDFLNKTITLSSNVSHSAANNPNAYIGLCDENGENRLAKSWFLIGTGQKSASYTHAEEDASRPYIMVALYSNNSSGTVQVGDYVDYANLQLEIGSTATDYEPYQSQTYTVDLGSTELCKIGTYQDYIYKSGDDWYVHKALGKSELGSLTWLAGGTSTTGVYRMYTNGLDGLYVAPPDNDTAGVGLCSHYLITANNPAQGSYGSHISLNLTRNGDTVFAFHPDYAASTSGAGFKTWLTDNNVVLYYALATSTDTQITDAGLIADLNALAGAKSYLDVTNFSVSATGTNLPALLKPEVYVKSLYSIIELLNSFKNNLVVVLPNGMTTYPAGEAPLTLDKALEAFQQGRSIFFVDYAAERTSIYTVSAVDANDGIWSMKVERIGANASETAGYWVIGTSNTTQWRRVDFYPNINITMQTTDPGEGQPLLANNFIGVYQ